MSRLALLAMLLVACERETPADDSTAVETAVEKAVVAATVPSQTPACPATGLWAECSVIYRLDRAGIAPLRDSAAVSEKPLTAKGVAVKVGRSDMELYVYPDVAARERELGTLDRTKYVEYPAPVPMKPVPTLIVSANLIAILHSRNDHLRERVSDAITAGPPQPSSRP